MRDLPSKLSSLTAALLIASSCSALSAMAQQPYAQQQLPPEQQTTMVLLRVVKEANGQQFVVTPRGFEIPVPAPGLAPNAEQLAVYRDYMGNYWYNNGYNQPVKVTAAQLQWQVGQLYGPQAAAVVGTPVNQQPYPQQPYPQQQQPAPVQQTTINEAPTQSSNGSSALGTGLAAAAGGMAGGMMGGMLGGAIYGGVNNGGGYYGMPYGTPMYRGADGHAYYYGKNGNTVNVNQNNFNKAQMDNWNKQGAWKDNPNNPYNQNHPTQPYNQNRPNNQNGNNLKNAQNNNKFNQGDNKFNQNGNKANKENGRQRSNRPMDGSGAKPFKGSFDGGGRHFGGRGGGGRRR